MSLIANAAGPGMVEALDTLNRCVETAGLGVSFHATGATLQSRATGIAGALGQLLVIVFAALADGSWARLRVCRYEQCQ